MRWRWLRREGTDSQVEVLEERVSEAQRKLDAVDAMESEVRQRVRALEDIARRNNFGPMVRRALRGSQ